MAGGRIKGITIEIDGSTTGLSRALKDVDGQIKSTDSALRDVNRLLKLDPSNTELLRQKQELLQEAVKGTKERLEALKTASEQAAKTAGNYDAWKKAYEPIQEEIGKAGEKAKQLKEKMAELEKAGKVDTSEYKALGEELKSTESQLKDLKQRAKDVSEEFGNPISHEQYDALQREIIETEQNLKSLEEQAKKSASVLGAQMQEVGRKMKEAGGSVAEVGKGLTANVSAPIAGLGTIAVKTVADFDSAMSQVSAVSGATGDDFLALRDKAREMGAKTKFSASEAAEAMNYMAMAGWKTGDMLDGIEGIMNLAAASGESLGTTSDIVTDALTAFGLSAADSGHFADVLAKASSNANTNVGMMGETFKYVAPVAGALGYSAEDIALAVGLMANSGIKASQAGTSLRSALTNLAKPTKEMQSELVALGLAVQETAVAIDDEKIFKAQTKVENKAIDMEKAQVKYNEAVRKYGHASQQAQTAGLNLQKTKNNLEAAEHELSVAMEGENKVVGIQNNLLVDSEGNMKSLREVMAALRESFSGLSEKEQAQSASTLFGKEAMSGMLAVVNASEADFNKLMEAIDSSAGAAQEMADVMNDNLSGQTAILMSQLQELAISIGDTLMPAVRDVVGIIQDFVDRLNSMDEGTKNTIVTIGLIVAAVGPVLIAIGKVVSAVGSIMAFVPKLVSGFNLVKGAFSALGAALAANPIILIVSAVAAAVAAVVLLYQKCEWFRDAVNAVWDAICSFFTETIPEAWESLASFCSGILDSIQNAVEAAWNAVYTTISTWIQNIYDTVSSIFSSCLETIEIVWETIKNVIQVAVMFIAEILRAAFDIITLPFRFIWENCKEYILEAWEFIKGIVTDGISAVKDIVENVFNAVAGFIKWVWDGISNVISTVWDFIKTAVEVAITVIKMTIENVFNAVAGFVKRVWDGISNVISTVWDFIKTAVETAITIVKETVTKVFDAVKEKVTNVWNRIKTAIITPINAAKTAVSDTLDKIREKVSSIFEKVKGKVTDVWEKIKSAITKPITDAKNTVSNMIEKIKEKFNFSWEFPKLKLPHFSIEGEFSLSPPSVPHLGIEWYKKAMDSAMVMDTPTIFGYNAKTNQLLAGGEAGREVVSGEDHLVSLIGSVVREQYGQLGSQVDRLTSVVQQYFPQVLVEMGRDVVLDSGALVGRLAPKMDDRLGIFSRHKERGN